MKARAGLLGLMVSASAAVGGAFDNAAFYYWKAVGLMRMPRTPEQLEVVQFVEEELPLLSPRIFSARPAVLNWLLSEQAIRDALHAGASCTRCDFGIRREKEPSLDLTHLPRLLLLCQRACAVAQAMEFADRPREAAQLYADLLGMIHHLASDQNRASDLAAADMMQTVLCALEGFLRDDVAAETLKPLSTFFRANRNWPFAVSAHWRLEADEISAWLLKDPPGASAWLQARAEGPLKPAADALRGATPAVFSRWVTEYRERMESIARCLEDPFERGAPALQRMDAEREALRARPGGNPLLMLLVPAALDPHQRLLLAKAQVEMAALLCAAAEAKAETGQWPSDIGAVARRLDRAPPEDPFDGKTMRYRLGKGGPVLAVRIPRAMAETGRYQYTLDIAERARLDAERTREAIARARRIEFPQLFAPAAP